LTERRSLACARFSIPRRPFTVHSVRCREARSEKPQLVYEIIERQMRDDFEATSSAIWCRTKIRA